MPYEIGWFKEGHVFTTRYYGIVTIEEVQAANSKSIEMINASHSQVHNIVDTTGITRIPTDFRLIKDATSVIKDPNLGWLIVVGQSNPLILFLSKTLSQLARVRLKEVGSFDEALATLERVDVTMESFRAAQSIPQ